MPRSRSASLFPPKAAQAAMALEQLLAPLGGIVPAAVCLAVVLFLLSRLLGGGGNSGPVGDGSVRAPPVLQGISLPSLLYYKGIPSPPF